MISVYTYRIFLCSDVGILLFKCFINSLLLITKADSVLGIEKQIASLNEYMLLK